MSICPEGILCFKDLPYFGKMPMERNHERSVETLIKIFFITVVAYIIYSYKINKFSSWIES